MKPLLLAALAAILSCSPVAAEESPPDAPAMTGDEIVAMYQKRGTAPRASLYCGEGRREVEVFDDGAGGVLSFGPGPDKNFRIHPKRIDFARISKELSDAVLEQAERTSAGVLFRGRGGGPHPDYRSGPLKPETARGMIRRFAVTLLAEERENIRKLFLMCPLWEQYTFSDPPRNVPDRVLKAFAENFGIGRVRIENVRTIDSPDIFEIMGEKTEFLAITFSDPKEGANPVHRIRCVVSDGKEGVTLIRPETGEQDLTALLDRAGVTVRTAAEAERLAQAHAALLHRSFLRQVKTEATAEGFTVRAERKEGWSQAKGVTEMEYRIKLGPAKQVSAIHPIPGRKTTAP